MVYLFGDVVAACDSDGDLGGDIEDDISGFGSGGA